MTENNTAMEVCIVSDDTPFISSFYCPKKDLEMIMELAQERLEEIEKSEAYINPRIEVRVHRADL